MFKKILNAVSGKSTDPVVSQSAKTILIVDDSEVDRKLYQSILIKKGYKVLVAQNGMEGIMLAKAGLPDLILLDFVMPDLQGPQVCYKLKNEADTKNIPVVFLTGLETPDSVIDSYEQGAEGYLKKPVGHGELIRQIEQIFEEVQSL